MPFLLCIMDNIQLQCNAPRSRKSSCSAHFGQEIYSFAWILISFLVIKTAVRK